MRPTALLLLLGLSACGENLSHTPPPMDHFFFPAGMALTPVAGGNQPALLVVSSNFDLRYDKQLGATLLSVDPAAAEAGGSLGRANGDLVKLGPGGQLGSYAGPVAIADAGTCPGLGGGAQAFVASRYTRQLYRFPVGADGSVAPCDQAPCQLALDKDLLDPAPVGFACRDDGLRKSLFVSYLRAPAFGGYVAWTGWLTEFDLRDLTRAPRTIALAPGPVGDMAFEKETDRLYAVGRFAGLTAPLYILDLPACFPADASDTSCPTPRLQTIDLYQTVRGAELVGIALSNPQPGRPRLAYISARIYDETYALLTGTRPSFDVGGALLVVEIQEAVSGEPLARVRQVVPIGLGAGAVRVLPVRPGLGDLVVVASTGDGSLQLFDDELHVVSRVVTMDQATGAPEAGHVPYALAVEDRGAEALVYVASFVDSTVSALRVPLADPAGADMVRDAAGNPLRIGRKNQ